MFAWALNSVMAPRQQYGLSTQLSRRVQSQETGILSPGPGSVSTQTVVWGASLSSQAPLSHLNGDALIHAGKWTVLPWRMLGKVTSIMLVWSIITSYRTCTHSEVAGKVYSYLPGDRHIWISDLLKARSPWGPEGVSHWYLHPREPSVGGISPSRWKWMRIKGVSEETIFKWCSCRNNVIFIS